ncbi:MAG TPA: hypothetical protein HPP76_04485 [Desulfuromonadales bacterium]|nr:hypothetical protein [Desulfuromonadales bacterium]
MAKPTMLKLALVIALTMAASSAYATTKFTGATAVGGTSFSSSNKVSVYAASDAVGSYYVVNSAHDLGDKCIAAAAGDAKLYYTTAAAGSASTIACTVVTTTVITGWTSM